jgi:hypothetical protein
MQSRSPQRAQNPCQRGEDLGAYALEALPAKAMRTIRTHISTCPECRGELGGFRSLVDRFVSWPTDVLPPTSSLQGRLALRIAEETGEEVVPPPTPQWSEPEWEQVAAGIECKLLASDSDRHRVSMLVRLAPGANYPPHTHTGVEELHLLDGELWIDSRKLLPGDYYYAAAGSGDDRVRSETGCTCILITSTKDILR